MEAAPISRICSGARADIPFGNRAEMPYFSSTAGIALLTNCSRSLPAYTARSRAADDEYGGGLVAGLARTCAPLTEHGLDSADHPPGLLPVVLHAPRRR